MLEDYRQLFLPEMTNNEWFKQTTKAYVVEGKSLIPEVALSRKRQILTASTMSVPTARL